MVAQTQVPSSFFQIHGADVAESFDPDSSCAAYARLVAVL